VARTYHASALLLPDARVLVNGSGDASGATDAYSAEIFSPPYLFDGSGNAATRPAISSAPATAGYGQTIFVGSANAASISKVTLIRIGSVTHAFNMGQRINRLAFAQATGGLNVTMPANAIQAQPGYYMLFILNGSGVPSVARIIHLQ
jgi:hypothetical protein